MAAPTPNPSPDKGLSPSSISPRYSHGLKKNPAIRRILREEGIETNEQLGYPAGCRSGPCSFAMRREQLRERERQSLRNLLRKGLNENPNQYDRAAGALINHGPPIDHSNRKHNPTGQYGIGHIVPGEVKAPERGRALTRKDMIAGLRWFVAHNSAQFHRLAFTTFVARNLGLCDVSLLHNYLHLRYIYIPMNWLRDLKPFTGMRSLNLLDASDNVVVGEQGDIPCIGTLEILSLAGNQIADVSHIPRNFYIYLNLSHNQIEYLVGFFPEIYGNLEILELRGNRIKSLGILDLPYLKHLWIADNALTTLKGLAGCPELVSIHARGNQIKSLFGFPYCLHKLQYVNLRDNVIEKLRYIRFLGRAPLQVLILIGNTCRRMQSYSIEALACVPTLVRLDKMKLTSCDLEAAWFLREGRMNRTLPPMSSILAAETPPPSPRGDNCVFLIDCRRDPKPQYKKEEGLGTSNKNCLEAKGGHGSKEMSKGRNH